MTPRGPNSPAAFLTLYCHTHNDGNGYHYDWITSQSPQTHERRDPPSTPGEASASSATPK